MGATVSRLPLWARRAIDLLRKQPEDLDFLADEQLWAPQLQTLASVMFDSSQPMFVAWGKQRSLLYNEAYAEILGERHPSAFGLPISLVWSDVWDVVGPICDRAYQGQSTHMDDLALQIIRHGERQTAHFSFSYTPITGASKSLVLGVFCVCAESTAAVKADVQLRQVLDVIGEGFVVLDEQFFVCKINAEGVRLDGRPEAEIVGRSHWDLWPASVGTPIEAAYRKVATERVAVQLRHHYVGEMHDKWIEVKAYPVPEGLAVFYRDVTALVEVEQSLRHSVDRFRAATQAVGVLWTNDAAGMMVNAQPGWSGLTGQTEAEYQGHGWAAAVHPDDAQPTIDAWLQAVAETRPFVFEHRVRRHDGVWRKFSIRAVPVFDAAGAVREWVGVHIDITEVSQAYENLRTADRQKDELLATLAHELLNPLAPLRSAAALLSQPDLPFEKRGWLCDVILRQTQNLTLLLNDMLDAARVSSGRLRLRRERIDLETAVQGAVEMARHLIDFKRHQLKVTLTDGPLLLDADPLRMTQILANLLTNAAKYTDPGGTIRVVAKRVERQIQIDVVDNGVGIAAESLPVIFDMFGQVAGAVDRAEGGLGIGLALTKNLVELHGGSVQAFSDGLGKGSRFRLVFAAADAESENPSPARHAGAAVNGSLSPS